MIKRTQYFLAAAVLVTLALLFQPRIAVSQQAPTPKPTQQQQTPAAEGTGAAQPEPNESEHAGEPEKKSAGAADEIRNAPAVRFIARMTGLSNIKAYWLSIILNFAILAFFLGLVLRKALPATFKSRNDSIQKRIEEARRTSEEARERLKVVESRLSRLDTEIADMRREAEENARSEEKRVLAEAEDERRRIRSAAEQEINAVSGNARRELKAYAAELAVNLAGKKIRVGKDADQSLVREFTAELGRDGN